MHRLTSERCVVHAVTAAMFFFVVAVLSGSGAKVKVKTHLTNKPLKSYLCQTVVMLLE